MHAFLYLLFVFIISTCNATYYSQCGQDRYINEHYFHGMKKGTFVDIGAHDGITYSNTYFYEKELGWSGICVEPIPEVFAQLKMNRKCSCIQGCVTDRTGKGQLIRVSSPFVNTEMLSGLADKYDPRHLDRMKNEIAAYGGTFELIDVDCYLLKDLLKEQKMKHINLLSVDTEGGECAIITSINFAKYKIDVITVEDNYGDPRFIPYLTANGYIFVERLGQDLVFVRKDFNLKKIINID